MGRLRAGVEVVLGTKNWSKANLDSVELPFACGMQVKYRDDTCPIISRGHWWQCAQSLARRSFLGGERGERAWRLRGRCASGPKNLSENQL